ncbi:MAG: hypothetical protein ACFFGZ_15540 [Candidatus Thorarchaeota archaeon]
MNKESNYVGLLALCALFFPAFIFFSMLVHGSQFAIDEINEIPHLGMWLLIFTFWISPISWSLLLGWYIIGKVSQRSMSSIMMLEELQSQEMLYSESNNGSQNDFFDNNVVS